MATMEEYARQSVAERLARLARTADELTAAVRGRGDEVLCRRPDAKSWAATEVLCHLRDTEEAFMARLSTMMAMDDPKLLAIDADRWAHERQYLRSDAMEAVAAFRKRREESLALLRALTPAQWRRAGLHPTRGRMTVDDVTALMSWHDDNHLDQLRRALDGRV
jgi:hypothetical protein